MRFNMSGDEEDTPRERVISSTPKISSRRLHFVDDEDEQEDSATEILTIRQPPNASFSPPYRKVRALRLLDRPLTPRTLSANSVCTPPRRSRLFLSPFDQQQQQSVDGAETSCSSLAEVPSVNINPFTPQALRMQKNKKRMRDQVSPGLPGISSQSNIPMMTFSNDQDMNDDSDLQPPSKRLALSENNISRYHHEFAEVSLLGTGQFSRVYKCINRLDGCMYAIKRSKKPVAGSSNERAALNEVWAHAVLDWHENLVGYHSAWAEHNHMYIQTEYCNRGTLADKIANESLEFPECQRLLQQIAEGLNYMHSHSLVHLDIKPDNIFISVSKKRKRSGISYNDSADDGFAEDEELTYKIGDLGHVTSTTDAQVEEGDCRYLPLEVLQENYSNLKMADIYSLGLTVLEASGYGPMPKNGEEWQQLREGKIPKDVKYLPSDFLELLKSMIDPDPLKRPTCEQILLYRKVSHVTEATKSYEQLHREYKASVLKAELLSKQLEEATRCIKSLTPDTKRLIGKKKTRSVSSLNF